MGLFNFGKKNGININNITDHLADDPSAVLIDVREPGEYYSGHIPGSVNCSVGNLEPIISQIRDKAAPVYVYCQSGARSGRAKRILEAAGFSNVTNLGGIMGYHGPQEY